MLASLARVLGIVKGFVRENREVLGKDIELLTSLLERVDNGRRTRSAWWSRRAPLALSNLAIAFESRRARYGSRVQVAPGVQFRPDQFLDKFLCSNNGVLAAACPVLGPLLDAADLPRRPGGAASAKASEPAASASRPADSGRGSAPI